MLLVALTCFGRAAQPVWNPLLWYIILEPASVQRKVLPSAVRTGVEEKLPSTRLVDERTHECPEDREDSGCSDDEDPAQRLRVVGFADLDDVQQRLHPWSPQMTHIQSI